MLKKILTVFTLLYAAATFAAIDANQASAAELDSIKGIGPGLSGKIMDVRQPYKLVDVEIYANDRVCTPSKFDTDGKVYWDIEFKEIEL